MRNMVLYCFLGNSVVSYDIAQYKMITQNIISLNAIEDHIRQYESKGAI